VEGILTDHMVSRLRRNGRLAPLEGGRTMNLRERAACDGLLDEDASIMQSMEWLREHCERLAWELESTGRELKDATAKLRLRERGAE